MRVKRVQDRSMMEQKPALALLGIPRALPAGDCQVAGAGQLKPEVSRSGLPDGREVGEGVANPAEDESERRMNFPQGKVAVVAQDQAITQTPMTQKHSAAAAGASKNCHPVGLASELVDILGESAAGA